jgi:hypothetical protein
VITSAVDSLEPSVASRLRERQVAVTRLPLKDVSDFLNRWRRLSPG